MYRTIIKNVNYLKLLCANIINRFGDSIDAIAFTWFTYTFTKSASLSAIVFAANLLPTVIFQPLAAPIVDQMKKKKIMVYTDLIRGILLAAFVLLFLFQQLQPWMFVVFTFLTNSVEAFRVPAGVAFVPQLVKGKDYDVAVSLNQVASTLCQLAGTALGGVLVAISLPLAMLIDVASFFLSAMFIALIHVEEQIDEMTSQNNYFENLKGGLQYLRTNHIFMLFVISAVLSNALATLIGSLSSAYISGTLQESANYLSSANFILTICTLLTLIAYPKLSKHLSTSVIIAICNFGGFAFLYGTLAYLPNISGNMRLLIWVVLYIVYGLGAGLYGALINIMFAKIVEPAYLSRAAGIFNSAVTLTMPIISFLIAFVVKWIRIEKIFAIAGIISFFIMVLFLYSKNVKQIHQLLKERE